MAKTYKLSKKINNGGSYNYRINISKGEAIELGWVNPASSEPVKNLKKTISEGKLIVEGVDK